MTDPEGGEGELSETQDLMKLPRFMCNLLCLTFLLKKMFSREIKKLSTEL